MELTLTDLRKLNRYRLIGKEVDPNWKGNLGDILDLRKLPKQERISMVLRGLPGKKLLMFHIHDAERLLLATETPDPAGLLKLATEMVRGKSSNKKKIEATCLAARKILLTAANTAADTGYTAVFTPSSDATIHSMRAEARVTALKAALRAAENVYTINHSICSVNASDNHDMQIEYLRSTISRAS